MEQHFQKFPKKAQPRKVYPNFQNFSPRQGAKKVIFTACHLGKLKLTFSIPNIISTSPKNVLMSRLISQFFCNLNSSNNFTCPLGKLITQFTSPITKSRSPRPSDTTFFACCRKFSINWTLLSEFLEFLVERFAFRKFSSFRDYWKIFQTLSVPFAAVSKF